MKTVYFSTLRELKSVLCCAVAVVTVLAAASAHAFPTKPITLVVPTAAGAGNDSMARIVATKLGALLGTSVIVENKVGASGAIAAEFVARAPADGHTLMWGYIATHSTNPALQKLKYDPVADFEPVGLTAYSPILMVANTSLASSLKAADNKALLQALIAQKGKFSYASAGVGTGPHFAAELFKLNTGADWTHVPYKGNAPAITDTIGGQTQVSFPTLFSAVPFVKSGKLNAIAVAGNKRSATLPNVPTLKELGINGVDVSQWYGIFAPAKTPKALIDQLNGALNKVLADKDVIKKIEDQGADVESSSPEELKKLVASELVKWKRVVQQAKITAE
jgi:tripartite-type tricarboxylate transporter receptor subunit TctC